MSVAPPPSTDHDAKAEPGPRGRGLTFGGRPSARRRAPPRSDLAGHMRRQPRSSSGARTATVQRVSISPVRCRSDLATCRRRRLLEFPPLRGHYSTICLREASARTWMQTLFAPRQRGSAGGPPHTSRATAERQSGRLASGRRRLHASHEKHDVCNMLSTRRRHGPMSRASSAPLVLTALVRSRAAPGGGGGGGGQLVRVAALTGAVHCPSFRAASRATARPGRLRCTSKGPSGSPHPARRRSRSHEG